MAKPLPESRRRRGKVSAAGRRPATVAESSRPILTSSPLTQAFSPSEVGSRETVRIRMYRQGLGDCFLLTFPGQQLEGFHVLVDCGVILGTPEEQSRMTEIVDDIADATHRRIDVVIATHAHWDHISGFDPDRGLFEGFTIGQVWLAWTEDPEDSIANQLRAERGERLRALSHGLWALRTHLRRDEGPDLSDDPAMSDARSIVSRAVAVLDFFGVDQADRTIDPATAGFASYSRRVDESRTARTMRWLRESASSHVRFLKPGEQVELPEAGGLRVYVLGPPTNLPLLRNDRPTRPGEETSALAGSRVATEETAFFAGLDRREDRIEFDGTLPFDPKYRIEEVDARNVEFFRDHYYGNGWSDRPAARRRIDDEAVQGAAHLALKLDRDTNNTSLALAFELPNGHVLLFPGDAQVGNWESWHAEGPGKPRTWQVGRREVTAESLLRRTVFYKAGHHGSHDATLREGGLELMSHPDLVVVLSVDDYVARAIKGWANLPFPPLVQRLAERSHGRVITSDRPLGGEEWLPRLPAGVTGPPRPAFLGAPANVKDAGKTFSRPFQILDDEGEATREQRRPLYVDVEIPFHSSL